MKKTKSSLFRVLAVFVLFPFSFIAGPGYVEWEDLDPDDGLDLFEIPQNLVAWETLRKDRPSVSCPSDFCPNADSIQCHSSLNTYSRPFIPGPTLSDPLRC